MLKHPLRAALALSLPAALLMAALWLAGGSELRSAVFALMKLAVTR